MDSTSNEMPFNITDFLVQGPVP